MIERLSTLPLRRRHPSSGTLSRYLDGELDAPASTTLEAHVRACPRCQRELASLKDTVRALGALRADSPASLADSIVAALRDEDPERAPDTAGQPLLTVLSGSVEQLAREPVLKRWSQDAGAAVRWCLRRRQLRLTLPIALVAGVVLSLVNMGGMLLEGRIDLGVCLSCAMDFAVPFMVLNLGLLMLLRLPRRGRR